MGLLLRCQEVRLSRQAGTVFYCDTIEVGLDWHFIKITLSASWKMDELGGEENSHSVIQQRFIKDLLCAKNWGD